MVHSRLSLCCVMPFLFGCDSEEASEFSTVWVSDHRSSCAKLPWSRIACVWDSVKVSTSITSSLLHSTFDALLGRMNADDFQPFPHTWCVLVGFCPLEFFFVKMVHPGWYRSSKRPHNLIQAVRQHRKYLYHNSNKALAELLFELWNYLPVLAKYA
jgi:hypothetical protein